MSNNNPTVFDYEIKAALLLSDIINAIAIIGKSIEDGIKISDAGFVQVNDSNVPYSVHFKGDDEMVNIYFKLPEKYIAARLIDITKDILRISTDRNEKFISIYPFIRNVSFSSGPEIITRDNNDHECALLSLSLTGTIDELVKFYS